MRSLLRALVALLLLTAAALADPWVVAHRGGALGPENMPATLAKAVALGVDAVEFDVHLSRDGQVVVIHDHTLVRTFGQVGRVNELTLAELQAAGVPSLGEALEAVGSARPFVELKHPPGARYQGLEEAVLDELRAHRCLERAVVISFDRESVRTVHALAPAVATGLLFGRPERLEEVLELGATYAAPHYALVNRAFVDKAHRLGLKVSTWTVDHPEAMKAMLALGVEAITTNHPQRLLELAPVVR
ncbi:MAG: glycerophosphodiester phosphodiesterase [Vulcanimicrobiota bacterium]